MTHNMVRMAQDRRRNNLATQRLIVAVALFGSPALAYAQTVSGGESPQTMINNVCTFILGPFGETIAVLGIIGIGFLFMFGRASLGVIAGMPRDNQHENARQSG